MFKHKFKEVLPGRTAILESRLDTCRLASLDTASIVLGRGNCAVVKSRLNDRKRTPVAVKLIRYTSDTRQKALQEVFTMRLLSESKLYHDDTIVSFIGWDEQLGSSGPATIYLVMELCDETLHTWINKHPVSPTQKYSHLSERNHIYERILIGVCFLHERGIIHNDLKPGNILIVWENGELNIKIGDFGSAKPPGKRFNGTIGYICPESPTCDEYSDAYSFGIIVFQLFQGSTEMSDSRVYPTPPSYFPEKVQIVLKKLLVAKSSRSTVSEVSNLKIANETMQASASSSLSPSNSNTTNASMFSNPTPHSNSAAEPEAAKANTNADGTSSGGAATLSAGENAPQQPQTAQEESPEPSNRVCDSTTLVQTEDASESNKAITVASKVLADAVRVMIYPAPLLLESAVRALSKDGSTNEDIVAKGIESGILTCKNGYEEHSEKVSSVVSAAVDTVKKDGEEIIDAVSKTAEAAKKEAERALASAKKKAEEALNKIAPPVESVAKAVKGWFNW